MCKPETAASCDFASFVEALSLSVPLAEGSLAAARKSSRDPFANQIRSKRTGTGQCYGKAAVLLTCIIALALVQHQDSPHGKPSGTSDTPHDVLGTCAGNHSFLSEHPVGSAQICETSSLRCADHSLWPEESVPLGALQCSTVRFRPRSDALARSFERLLAHHSIRFQPLVRYLPAPVPGPSRARSSAHAEDGSSEDLMAALFT
jgi:hypothetical protein